MDFLSLFSIFVLSVFVGFYVVWGVTPALHSPLLAVTNAISSVIIVGGLIAAVASEGLIDLSSTMGLIAVLLASVNIFGGFMVAQRMLAMFKKKKIKKVNINEYNNNWFCISSFGCTFYFSTKRSFLSCFS